MDRIHVTDYVPVASYEKAAKVEAGPSTLKRASRKRYSSPSPTKAPAGASATWSILTGELILIVSNYRFNRDTNGSRFVPCTSNDCDIGLKYSSPMFVADPSTDNRVRNGEYIFDAYGLLFNVGTFLSLVGSRQFGEFVQGMHEKVGETVENIQTAQKLQTSHRLGLHASLPPSTATTSDDDEEEEQHASTSASTTVLVEPDLPGRFAKKADAGSSKKSTKSKTKIQGDSTSVNGGAKRRVQSFFAS